MRQEEVFNKIGGIISELTEQYNYLKTQTLPLDDLELELFAANADFLGDHLEVLRKLNASLAAKPNTAEPAISQVKPQEIPTTVTEFIEPVNQAPDTEPQTETNFTEVRQPENQPASEFDFTPDGPQNTAPENTEDDTDHDDIAYLEEAEYEYEPAQEHAAETIQESSQEVAADTPVHDIDLRPDTGQDHFSFIRSTETSNEGQEFHLNESSAFSDDEPHRETIAEALADQAEESEVAHSEPEPVPNHYTDDVHTPAHAQDEKPLTFNDRMSAQMNSNAPAPAQPITDLKSAITLNDKMLFVRDLFNGYSLAYSEAIEILNRFNKLEDAQRFLSVNYEEKNNWRSKPEARRKFEDLLKRRFPN
ncbi:hypothetical protein [Mucilaginibacter ginkgonis]|uniref:Uncharacterized protein n=1 Tax=Mucilaginibacter ginkgonis TaxID=2682091 RepID=A0A6I4IML1_9SPHI|nr:hypothetical protein [Mucilaginibacter ginkgonis]QQL50114.1 hypothetical protein GO620_001285 [Mucilaginibacter ginkgonis]